MEQVIVTPQSSRDDDGNPVGGGPPVILKAFAVAPGNSTLQFTDSGNVDSVDFTVYFLDPVDVSDGDLIEVRGLECLARVLDWISPWLDAPDAGGMVILCSSDAGAS